MIAIAAFLSFVLPAKAQEQALWRIVAQADRIATGQITFDCDPSERSYVEVPFRSLQTSKGPEQAESVVRWWSGDADEASGAEHLCDVSSKDVIAFVVWADGHEYFLGNPIQSVLPASAELDGEISDEVERQSHLLLDWRTDPTVPHFTEVEAIIEQIATAPRVSVSNRAVYDLANEQQQALFDRLLALGDAAVPAMIMQMDDNRPLPYPQISLVNRFPGAFEGSRHYGPDVISDALEAILNDITGENFGGTMNGGTELQRKRAIAGWRVYLDQRTHLRF